MLKCPSLQQKWTCLQPGFSLFNQQLHAAETGSSDVQTSPPLVWNGAADSVCADVLTGLNQILWKLVIAPEKAIFVKFKNIFFSQAWAPRSRFLLHDRLKTEVTEAAVWAEMSGLSSPWPRHPPHPGGETESLPSHLRDIIPPANPVSASGPPPDRTCLEYLSNDQVLDKKFWLVLQNTIKNIF